MSKQKMKIYNLLIITVVAALSMPLFAQKSNALNVVKVKELIAKRESLKKQIAVEDSKRERTISGVSPETQEQLNEKQDSICLDLRSRLVSVELELKELSPGMQAAAFANHWNEIIRNQQQEQNATNTTVTTDSTGGKKQQK